MITAEDNGRIMMQSEYPLYQEQVSLSKWKTVTTINLKKAFSPMNKMFCRLYENRALDSLITHICHLFVRLG